MGADVVQWIFDWYASLPDIDEVTILRVAYTVAAVLGVPCAGWCLWASWTSWRTVRRIGINGDLLRAARGYQRRDVYRVGVLLLIAGAGAISLSGNLPLRSVFGLGVLLVIATWTTHDAWEDYRDRRATFDEDAHA